MTEPVARLRKSLADRYRIERELGQGGMATVYLAYDLKHDRKVAIKVLRPDLAAVIGAERFLAEIKVTANLQHPHILPLFDSGVATLTADDPLTGHDSRLAPRDLLFYVMPYVEGESLRTMIEREKQLGIDDAVRIGSQVAAALDYAHRHGVVHRDIKPENVLLHDGTALVADFGIALAATHAGASRMTATGMSLGTPAYMSPEQAMGDREVDARSDIYALGTMMYEMLVGDPPYMGSTAQAIVAKVLTEKPVPVTVHRDTVPANVAAAIQKALNKLPADRFSTAADFAKALATPGWTSGELVATVAMPSLRPAARPGRTGRALVAFALTALAAGAIGWFLRPPPEQPLVRYALAFPPTQSMELNRIGTNIDLSHDGSRFVYLGPGDQGGQLWLRQRDRLDATPLQGTAGAINPRFSPDGRQVAFSSGPLLDLRLVGVDGGTPVTIAHGGSGATGGIAWSDDGWIYFDAVAGLSRIRPGGGEPEIVVPLDAAHGEVGQAWPDVMPGSRWLVFRTRHSGAPDEFEIGAFDLKNHTRRSLTKGVFARHVADGMLGIVRSDGVLVVARVDPGTLELKSAFTPVLDGLRTKLLGSVDLVAAGSTLLYVRGTASTATVRAVWVSRDGVLKPIEPPVVVTPANNRGLALSPDGRRLVVDMVGPRSTDLWVKDLPSGPFSRLTFDGLENTKPSWTPDGQSVLYILNRAGTGVASMQVWRKRADGAAAPESVYATSHPINEALMSHDGRWLIYRVITDSGPDVYGIRLGQDTTPVPLLTGPFNEASPALSPDGRWLAYASNESGTQEVYVRPFPKVSTGRWQVSTRGGWAPRWSHSGRELFFVSGGDLMAASVSTSNSFSVETPHRLFGGFGAQFLQGFSPYYDTSPDDSRFLMMGVVGEDSAGVQVVAVENWLHEVRAKLAAAQH